MFTKRFGILLALAASAALAQSPNETISPLTTATAAVPHLHAPMRLHGYRPDGTTESTNWSGYAVTGTSFTSAVGSWVVPTATCTSGVLYASFWVGIDGYSSSTVEQTGTDSDCVGTGPVYYAWYEFYPHPSINIGSVPVSPGNQMSASVTYNGSEFTITITNETTGKSYTKSSTVSGAKRSSAEWIAEAPCCTSSGGILPLADK